MQIVLFHFTCRHLSPDVLDKPAGVRTSHDISIPWIGQTHRTQKNLYNIYTTSAQRLRRWSNTV